MALSYNPPEFTLMKGPQKEPSDSPQVAADYLARVRRRIYDTTADDNLLQVGTAISRLGQGSINLQCGHSTDLLSTSAQALVTEAEP